MAEIDLNKWENAAKKYVDQKITSSLVLQLNNYKEEVEKKYLEKLNEIIFDVIEVAEKRGDEYIAKMVLAWAGEYVKTNRFSIFKTCIQEFCKSREFAHLVESEHMIKIIEEDIKGPNEDANEHVNFIVDYINHSGSLSEINKLYKDLRNSKLSKKSVRNLFLKVDSKIEPDKERLERKSLYEFNSLIGNLDGRKRKRKVILSLAASMFLMFIIFSLISESLVISVGISVVNESITISYKESIPSDNFNIYQQKILYTEQVQIEQSMFVYNPEIIGQQTAQVKYRNQLRDFILIIEAVQLDTPMIYRQDDFLIINFLNSNLSFLIDINGIETELESNIFNLALLPEGSNQIKVKSISTTEVYLDSDFSEFLVLDKLSSTASANYNSNTISWEVIPDAEYYRVIINSEVFETESNTLTYDFTERNNLIRIQGVGVEPNSVSSDFYDLEIIKLNPVSNISYSNYRLAWVSSETEVTYLLKINDTEYETTNNYFEIILPLGLHDISIQTTDTNLINLNSDIVNYQFTFSQIEVPLVFLLEDESIVDFSIGIVKVDHADLYEISIRKYINNDQFEEVILNVDGMTNILINIDSYIKFEISIIAKNALLEYKDSEKSETLWIYKLQSTSNLSYSDNKLMWDEIVYATGYEVLINGLSYIANTNELSHILSTGLNSISIQAIGDPINTIKSDIYSYELVKLRNVSNVKYLNSQLTWESLENGVTYVIKINEDTYETVNEYLDVVLSIGVHDISIQVVDKDGLIIDSDVFNVQIGYEQLIDPVVHITSGLTSTLYHLTIDAVDNATEYSVLIQVFNGDDLEWESTLLLTDNLTHSFFVNATSTIIIVKVTAIDSTGEYANSTQTIREYTINE